VEKFLEEMNGVYRSDIKRVNFEVEDALNKVVQLGLVTQRNKTYTAVSISEALSKMDVAWQSVFSKVID
jgi:uncharacterized membrane protein